MFNIFLHHQQYFYLLYLTQISLNLQFKYYFICSQFHFLFKKPNFFISIIYFYYLLSHFIIINTPNSNSYLLNLSLNQYFNQYFNSLNLLTQINYHIYLILYFMLFILSNLCLYPLYHFYHYYQNHLILYYLPYSSSKSSSKSFSNSFSNSFSEFESSFSERLLIY